MDESIFVIILIAGIPVVGAILGGIGIAVGRLISHRSSARVTRRQDPTLTGRR